MSDNFANHSAGLMLDEDFIKRAVAMRGQNLDDAFLMDLLEAGLAIMEISADCRHERHCHPGMENADGNHEFRMTLDAKFVERAQAHLNGRTLDTAFLVTLLEIGLDYEEEMERADRIWDRWDEFRIPDRHEDDDELPF